MPRKPERPYQVGYGKPPIETRFQPGECGRHRKRRNDRISDSSSSIGFHAVLKRVLAKKVPVMDGGKLKNRSRLEILAKKLIHFAANDPRQIFSLMKLVEKIDLAEAEGKTGETQKIWVSGSLPDTEPGPASLTDREG